MTQRRSMLIFRPGDARAGWVIDIAGSRSGTGRHPVFGCAIAAPEERSRK